MTLHESNSSSPAHGHRADGKRNGETLAANRPASCGENSRESDQPQQPAHGEVADRRGQDNHGEVTDWSREITPTAVIQLKLALSWVMDAQSTEAGGRCNPTILLAYDAAIDSINAAIKAHEDLRKRSGH